MDMILAMALGAVLAILGAALVGRTTPRRRGPNELARPGRLNGR